MKIQTETKNYFVQIHNRLCPFFEEHEFETFEDAKKYADSQNREFSVEGGGDGAFYAEVGQWINGKFISA